MVRREPNKKEREKVKELLHLEDPFWIDGNILLISEKDFKRMKERDWLLLGLLNYLKYKVLCYRNSTEVILRMAVED